MPSQFPTTYMLNQIMTNPRDGIDYLVPFEEYQTKGDAMRAARKEFTGSLRWAVTETRVVAVDQVTAVKAGD